MRTFRRKHRDAFFEIFLQTVQFADQIGLIKLNKLFALDGSKFEANASSFKSKKKKDWEKRYDDLSQKVHSFLEACDEQDRIDEENDTEAAKARHMKEVMRRLSELQKSRSAGRSSKLAKKGTDQSPSSESQDAQSSKLPNNTKPDSAIEEASSSPAITENHSTKNTDNLDPKQSAREIESSPTKEDQPSSELSITEAENCIRQMEKIQAALEANADASDESYINLTDPESRSMKNKQAVLPSYNAQILTNQQVIVALDVTQDENDQNQLQPLVEQAVQNLKLDEREQETTIPFAADAGYNKGANLSYMEEQEVFDPHISMHNRKEESENEDGIPFEDAFEYDEGQDRWLCPQGHALEKGRTSQESDKVVSYYKNKPSHCVTCPLRGKCLATKQDQKLGYKSLRDDGFRTARQAMRRKLKTDEGKEVYRRRSGEVEGVIGQLKNCHLKEKLRRLGLANAASELSLGSTVHNLRKIMRYIGQTQGGLAASC